MKILVAVFFIFIVKINAKQIQDDSSKSGTLQNTELSEANTPVTGINTRPFPNKAKKFMVTLKQPAKTSFTLPKRAVKKSSIPKLQIQYNVSKGSIGIFPVLSTKRPHLMQTKKFISKPHTIDKPQQLVELKSFSNKRTPSKFNQYKAEETLKNIEKNEYKSADLESFEERFKNFTDIDMSIEDDSDETKENIKPFPRKFMKGAASHKVTTIASPPITKANVAKNYKIKDLLRNQKYMPQVERKKMVPLLALQKNESTISQNAETIPSAIQISKDASENNSKASSTNDYSPEEKADQNEFIFIKESQLKSMTITTSSPEDDEIVTMDTINDDDIRQERSVNIIEEESVATTSGTKFTAKDRPVSVNFAFKNIHT